MNRPATRNTLLGSVLLVTALAGCSPHPATGNWTTTGNGDDAFVRLEINYDGWANLYEAGEQEAGRHCFWSGRSADQIALSCKAAVDPNVEEHYRLVVDANGTASLTRDGAVIAAFSRP